MKILVHLAVKQLIKKRFEILLIAEGLSDRGPGEEVYRHLASICDLAGGQLRNVVLTAAVYATGHSINNANLLEGLRAEYRKQGRDLPRKLEGLNTTNRE